MGIMRRHIRYTPLGKGRTVTVVLAPDDRRDAEVHDESVKGLGLRMDNITGLAIGSRLVVESHKDSSTGIVRRLLAAPDGGFLVGLQYTTDGTAK